MKPRTDWKTGSGAGGAPGAESARSRARRRCAAATALYAVGCIVWGGEDSSDRLWLRQGDPWVGHLLDTNLVLQTPYARLEIPVVRVDSVHLAQGPEQWDRIHTVADDRLTGFVLNPQISFQPRNGSRLSWRRDQVARIVLDSSSAPTSSQASVSNALVFMRNGDTISGRILGGPFRVSTPQTDVLLDLGDLAGASFSDTYPVLAQINRQDREKLEGIWPDQPFEIMMDIGLALRVYPSRISSIELGAGAGRGTGIHPTGAADPMAAGAERLDLVWIPPGDFVMGSSTEEKDRDLDEGPQTRVRITQGFWMSRYEVTQAQYREVMNENPSLFIGDGRRPVEKVRYRDAVEFCDRLTRQHLAEGRLPAAHAYRLPSEAEWEYACRAGTTTRFSHGDDLREYELEAYAWFSANSDSSTHPVGTRKPNPWGLYDVHGNVLEWCLDGASSTLPGGEVQDPLAPVEGLLRIARGGSWLYGAKAARSANRDSYGESTRSSDLGFRYVLAPVR